MRLTGSNLVLGCNSLIWLSEAKYFRVVYGMVRREVRTSLKCFSKFVLVDCDRSHFLDIFL